MRNKCISVIGASTMLFGTFKVAMPDGVRDAVISRLIAFFEGDGRNSCFTDVFPRLVETALTSDLHPSFANPCVLGVMRQSLSSAMLGAFFSTNFLTDTFSDRVRRQIVDVCCNLIISDVHASGDVSGMVVDPFMPMRDPAFYVDIYAFIMRELRPVVDVYRKVIYSLMFTFGESDLCCVCPVSDTLCIFVFVQISSLEFQLFEEFLRSPDCCIYFDNVKNGSMVTVRGEDGALVDVKVCLDSASINSDITTPLLDRLMNVGDADVELMDSDLDNVSDDSDDVDDCSCSGNESDRDGECGEDIGDCKSERKRHRVSPDSLDVCFARDVMESV